MTLNKNLWYDFGMAKGGNVIDLVILIKSCSPKEALQYLSSHSSFFFNPPEINFRKSDETLQVFDVKEIRHPALVQYLRSRSISVSTAKLFCKEVWYKYNGENYFSIGLPNSSGGWELRNKFFQNSTAPKSYSIISNGKGQLVLFEGMFDLLSLATIDKDLVFSSDCLVLNSIGFLDKCLPLLNAYSQVYSYLDNDPAGKKANQKLKELNKSINDCSSSYEYFKDLNEKLMLQRQQL